MARISGVDLPREKRVEIGLIFMESVFQAQNVFWQRQMLILILVYAT